MQGRYTLPLVTCKMTLIPALKPLQRNRFRAEKYRKGRLGRPLTRLLLDWDSCRFRLFPSCFQVICGFIATGKWHNAQLALRLGIIRC